MANMAPYKIEKRGDKYVVLNNASEVKATFDSYAKATDYLQALYASVPGAQKKAAKTKWTGTATAPKRAAASVDELAQRWAPTLRRREEAVSEGLPEVTDRESLLAAIENASGYVEQRQLIIDRAESLDLLELIPTEWFGVGPVLTAATTPSHSVAMPSGAFKIVDKASLLQAIKAARYSQEREHVILRAKALGLMNLIPKQWVTDGGPTLKAEEEQAADTLQELMGGGTVATTTLAGAQVYNNGTVSSIQPIYTNPLVPPAPAPAPVVEEARAFTTEVNGKTILTAPARAVEDRELAAAGNKHFLWISGRFVGAEQANRNNAYWSSGDLELGQTSVANGPLNWLHEARHVIGTIAKADFIPGQTAGPETAAETVQPHIAATSAVWKWLWPDEAWVLEQASDAQKLWYSMECISDSVKCRADGCGTEVAYAAYLNDLGCSHMAQRSSVRHFANPTFLGGAVIVPPARPGWADADASILTQAAGLAEKAFDQAGRPDMPASEWEQLMAQVLTYAR